MSTSTAPGMRVKVGDPVPSVGLRATDGYLLNLRSSVTRRPSLLIFFGAPTLEGAAREAGDALAAGLKSAHKRIEAAGLTLMGITCDNTEQQIAYVKEQSLPFLLYSDERRSAVELLGVPTTVDGENYNAVPTAFAVGIDGTIVDIVENVQPKGLIARLLESVEEAKTPPTET
jgi:Peroxiredoxin